MRQLLIIVATVLICAVSLPALAAEKPMKVGFVYVSPVNEGGWSLLHDQGRKAVEALPGVQTFYAESVPEGADSERTILQMARKGYDIIVTTSFGYMDPTIKVAAQYPKITFLHCSGFKTADNVSTYFGRIYQSRYLTGMVAGSMTKSNVIGYVAAFPIPEVVRGINAFTLGVREVNPKAEVRVIWTNTWYDPATEKQAAKTLLDVGADVVAQHQNSPGPQEAAQEKGAYSIGYNSDMSSYAPDAHLVAAVWNWAPFYVDMVEQVRAGTWKSGAHWPGIESGIVDISPYGKMVPQQVRDLVDARKKEIGEGDYTVFAGPVRDQSGEVRIPEGQSPTDEELLGMNWFVQGVVGTLK